jgi:hypothetical protein
LSIDVFPVEDANLVPFGRVARPRGMARTRRTPLPPHLRGCRHNVVACGMRRRVGSSSAYSSSDGGDKQVGVGGVKHHRLPVQGHRVKRWAHPGCCCHERRETISWRLCAVVGIAASLRSSQ